MPIIAISGQHGSGKTTAAKELAKHLGYEYVSAGYIFREMAKERNLSLEEFTHLAESDVSIDKEIDNRTVELAKKGGNLVIDAQLAGWILKDHADLLVCISASIDTRIARIKQRENRSYDEVRSETLMRERSEQARYKALYSYVITDLSIYDLIINTDRIDAPAALKILLKAVTQLIN